MQDTIRLGHVNVFHLYNKLTDLQVHLNSASPKYDIFGVTESRLHQQISKKCITIPEYCVFRRDRCKVGETGIAVYVHQSIIKQTMRRKDLEPEDVECLWLELKLHHNSSSLFICYVYRNPNETNEWYDKFTKMYDRIQTLKKGKSDLILIGDFNIDLLKHNPLWDSIISSFGLTQLINNPTRITSTSSTLIDHIYVNNASLINKSTQPNLSISDHGVISCERYVKRQKQKPNIHSEITFRSFKHFNTNAFLIDLSMVPFDHVYCHTDPNEALSLWYNLYLPVLNKHAPMKTKRIKHTRLPPWLNNEIIRAMEERDKLKKDKRFDEYKKLRNKIKNKGVRAKNNIFKN